MQRYAWRGAVGLMLLASWHLSCGRHGSSSFPGASGGQGGWVVPWLNGGGGGHGGGHDGGGAGGVSAGEGGHAGSGGSAGAAGGSAGGVGGAGATLDGSPIYTRVQRLTREQWQQAVTDILRLDAPTALVVPAVPKSALDTTDFANNEKLLFVDPEAQVGFEAASEAAATRATGTPDALARLYAGTDAPGFVRALGRRAFRRPLTADEEQSYQRIFAAGETLYGAGFANGAALVIRAMLSSPKFLYRSELGPAGAALSGYEVAAKLSFWLLGTTPSDDLLDAAAAGGLDTASGVESTARMMLERPAAAAMMRDFHGQLYHLGRYDAMSPAGASEALRSELAESSFRFFDAIFTHGEPLGAVFTSTRFFAGPTLAPLYGLNPPPAGIEERSSDAARGGYFTQVPFLMANGAPDGESDPIARGAALSQEALCIALDEHATPPPAVAALTPGQTNRQRIEAATSGCGACHTASIDPLGFAFEGFDGLGRARDRDNGSPVDTKATYTFAGGARTFADAKALMAILADSPEVQRCYAKRLVSYALQRDVAESDRTVADDLATTAREHSLKEVILSLVRSPAFRLRAPGGP